MGHAHPSPGLLCRTCTVQGWGAKGLGSRSSWGSSIAPLMILFSLPHLPQNSSGRSCLSQEPPKDASYLTITPKAGSGGHSSCLPCSRAQDPPHPLRPIFHPLSRARHPWNQHPAPTISPILAQGSPPGLLQPRDSQPESLCAFPYAQTLAPLRPAPPRTPQPPRPASHRDAAATSAPRGPGPPSSRAAAEMLLHSRGAMLAESRFGGGGGNPAPAAAERA